jgi:LacI family repressor for deo operon, udp, cdd, tsx, nupC, and nupG
MVILASESAAMRLDAGAMKRNEQSQPQRPVNRPTMADVARLAGVTPGTVSRALAGSPLVTAETRARIDATVHATGYVIHHAARNLRENRSRQVLIALPNIANPFFAEVVAEAEEAAQAAGYGVLIGNTAERPDGDSKIAQNLLTGAVDGLLLNIGHVPAELAGLQDIGRKVVAVAVPIPGFAITSVAIDQVSAAKEAVSYLIALGHRRIAHIGGPPSVTSEGRLKGYRLALSSAGIAPNDALVRFGHNTIPSGQAAATELLADSTRPTALFCANDEMAIGAIIAAKSIGLRVPGDLSVVGFDDIEMAAFYDPPLTTIHQPRREIGRVGLTELLALLEGRRKRSGRRITLEHSLIVRGSTEPVST